MKRVLIYIAETGSLSSNGIHLDLALTELKKGNEVVILSCDDSIGVCMENCYRNSLFCKLCMHLQKKDVRRYMPIGVEHRWISEFVNKISPEAIISFDYSSVSELRSLTYKGVEIGMGALSTYISQTRNLNPEINEESRSYFDELLRQQVLTELVLERIYEEYKFDLVIFQNGRGAQYKPFLNFCHNFKVDYICTEDKRSANGETFLNLTYNDTPHSIYSNYNKYISYWESSKLSDKEKESIARRFYENRRNSVFSGDKLYVKDQIKGKLPDNWNHTIENIVLFNSSEDEFAAVSKEYDDAAFFASQLDGIKTIVTHYLGDTSKHFTLRVHPNLQSIQYMYHLSLYELDYPNLTIIRADSPVSTYALIDAASKVIVFGSTTGVESVYWGKPVICLAGASYLPMNITYRPKDLNNLWDLIDTNNLACLYNENVLKFGFYHMNEDFSKTNFIDIDWVRFRIFGRTLQCQKYQKLLGSNFLYALLIPFYHKFLMNKFPAKYRALPIQEEKGTY